MSAGKKRKPRAKKGGISVGGKKKAGAVYGLGKKKAKRPMNPWLKHVKDVRDANPGMSYKEAMQAASQTYKRA